MIKRNYELHTYAIKKELIEISESLQIAAITLIKHQGTESADAKYLEELAQDILIRAKEVKEESV